MYIETTRKKVNGSCSDIFTSCTLRRAQMAMTDRPVNVTNMQAILPPRGTCSSLIDSDILIAVFAVSTWSAVIEVWGLYQACVRAARRRAGQRVLRDELTGVGQAGMRS